MNNIVEVLMLHTNIDVSKFDEAFLRNSVQKQMKKLKFESIEAYIVHLKTHPTDCELFLDSLFINYSEFFRHPLTFSVLENILIPQIVSELKSKRHKEVRIWSAACAGGEEIYSVAMLMNELTPQLGEQIRFRLFASDYADDQLSKAQKGEYPASALKNISLIRLNNWFTKHGQVYSVKPELKEKIDFSVFDLLNQQRNCPEESIFGDFDIVFCANILFYYKPYYQKMIIEKAYANLREGGYIITSETERNIFLQLNFEEVFPHSAIFTKNGNFKKIAYPVDNKEVRLLK